MRIIIPEGKNCVKALRDLADYLEANASDYPVLKEPMNVYVDLESERGVGYPLNDPTYLLDGSKIVEEEPTLLLGLRGEDVYTYFLSDKLLELEKKGANELEAKRFDVKNNDPYDFIFKLKYKERRLMREIDAAQKKYDEACLRKYSTADKWKTKMEELNKELEQTREEFERMREMYFTCKNAGKMKWEYVVERDKNYKLLNVYCRCVLKPDNELFPETLYVYPSGFSNESLSYRDWFKN